MGVSLLSFLYLFSNFMAAPTKNQKIEALVKLVQKRCRGVGLPKPPRRTVFETLMYAALLENATFDKADLAYTVLENYYIDWNEIRVCSIRELADTLMDLPQPEAAAERVRKALQGIFEKTYMFEFEDMRKKGKALAEHIKTFESMSAGTPFMIQYVAQVALDGHLIPLDEASLRIMRRLGLSQVSNDGTQEVCLGLDRVILKKSGLTFAAQLHHFAAGYYDVPDSPELLSLLSAIDKGAVDRSWASPVLKTPPAPLPAPEPVPPPLVVKPTVPSKKETPPKKETPAAKPLKKTVPTKPSPTEKKAPVKVFQPPVKKAPPKKSTKPILPTKKKTVVKKGPAEPIKKGSIKKGPVKKVKGVSPSQTLRKRKPK